MADTSWRLNRATMHEIRRHARAMAYLGTADKLRAALANEYGSDRKLPSIKELQAIIDERNAPRKPYGGTQAMGCEL